MRTYVYSCSEHPDQAKEVIHSIEDCDTHIEACPICQAPMHRIPQAFRFGQPAHQLLLDKMYRRFQDFRRIKYHERYVRRKPASNPKNPNGL